jgi:hypothetical protein
MIRCFRALLCLAILLMTAAAGRAQTSETGGLSNLLPDLILRGITLPGGADPGSPHAGHFTLLDPRRGSQAASITSPEGTAAAGAVLAFNDRLRSQLANFPLGSSAGGFTYTYDPQLGTYTRRTDSFGPGFTERAATIGRGRRSVGFNFQHTSFDSFGGEDLDNGSITFYLPHTDCCNPAAPPPSPLFPGFEGDLLEVALHMKATTDTLALLGNFGVTDRLDVGVAVPITRVDLETRAEATILRLSTALNPNVHTFTQGQDNIHQTFTSAGTATGIGDIVLRSKYNFLGRGASGLAAAVDVRLPTGAEEDLLGLGTTQAKFLLIMSGGNNRFSPHVNIGYTVSGTGDRTEVANSGGFRPLGVSDEFNYAGGVELVVSPQLTVIGDVIGRTLIDAGNVEAQAKSYQYRVQGATRTDPLQTSQANPITHQPYRQLTLSSGNLNLVLGAVGAKFNPFPNVLLSGHVLFPMTEAGLRDRLTVAVGLDFAF